MTNRLTDEAFVELLSEILSEWIVAHAENVGTTRKEIEVNVAGAGHLYRVTVHDTTYHKPAEIRYEGGSRQEALAVYNSIGD